MLGTVGSQSTNRIQDCRIVVYTVGGRHIVNGKGPRLGIYFPGNGKFGATLAAGPRSRRVVRLRTNGHNGRATLGLKQIHPKVLLHIYIYIYIAYCKVILYYMHRLDQCNRHAKRSQSRGPRCFTSCLESTILFHDTHHHYYSPFI
jgi:hypothetical protein